MFVCLVSRWWAVWWEFLVSFWIVVMLDIQRYKAGEDGIQLHCVCLNTRLVEGWGLTDRVSISLSSHDKPLLNEFSLTAEYKRVHQYQHTKSIIKWRVAATYGSRSHGGDWSQLTTLVNRSEFMLVFIQLWTNLATSDPNHNELFPKASSPHHPKCLFCFWVVFFSKQATFLHKFFCFCFYSHSHLLTMCPTGGWDALLVPVWTSVWTCLWISCLVLVISFLYLLQHICKVW